MKTFEFMECDTCRVKTGSPTLCSGCLHNRAIIEELKPALHPFTNKKIHFHGVHPCYNDPCMWF